MWLSPGIEHKKNTIPPQLKKRNLGCNQSKTEQYEITQMGDQTSVENLQIHKKLGTMRDTVEDIKRQKILAWSSMQELIEIKSDMGIQKNTKNN